MQNQYPVLLGSQSPGTPLSSREVSSHSCLVPVHFAPEHLVLVQTSSSFKHKRLESDPIKRLLDACSLKKIKKSIFEFFSVTSKILEHF